MNHQIFIDQKDGTKQLDEFVACGNMMEISGQKNLVQLILRIT